jgi:single-stranded-DNA-specific exonuclease
MSSAILNIDKSLMLSRWVFPDVNDDHIARMVSAHGVPEIVARLLSSRKITPDQVEVFLSPKIARDFPDPFKLKGMDEAATELADAVLAGRKMALFADFDVDGATSTAILVRFFRHCGIEMPFYIPDRLTEGYGPNINALSKLKADGAEIVLMADCGTTAFDVVAQGREIGLDIIILDHHEAEDKLPAANHLINPKRKDDDSGYTMLAACGVSFMLCVAVNAKLREKGFFKDRPEAPLKNLLDLLALGTVCDMVPLLGPNRLFVKFGFDLMNRGQNTGIKALCEVAGVKTALSTYHAGFVLGPRINAGSRVHRADIGARLLSTDDAEEAKNLAWTLNDCNDKRKDIQSEMMAQALARVEDQGLDQHPVILVGDEGWHPGLNGLVAGRLVEKYKKPAAVIAYAPGHDNALEGRGSGRSVPGINIAAAFIDARNAGLIVKGGGHAMAAGFTILPEQIPAFRAFLYDHVARQSAGHEAVFETQIDGVISVRGARVELVKMLADQVGPFGMDNPEPLFVLPNVKLDMVGVVGDGHIRMMISDSDGGGTRMKAMAFRAGDTPMGQAILKSGQQRFHLAGRLKLDTWNGAEKVEFHVEDAAPALSGTRAEAAE